jgi:hypothetical protein
MVGEIFLANSISLFLRGEKMAKLKEYKKEITLTVKTQEKHCENMCDGLTTYYTNGVSCLIYNEDLLVEGCFTYLRCPECLNEFPIER